MATKQKVKQNRQEAVSAQIGQPVTSLKKYYYLFGLLTFFLFANTLGNGYNMDDGMVTRNHPLTSKGLSAISEIFTSPYYSDAMGYAYGYRPMVHLSFALEHDLFGEKPGAGHFINVILFALSVVLFFKLLVKWVGEKNALFAGIATLLFAVHPIHTEVVASLKNRDEILAFLFSIWAALAAYKYTQKGKWISIVSVLLLFSIAMLSKKSVYPMAIIIPASYLLLNQLSLRQLIGISVPFIIPAAVIGSELQINRLLIMAAVPLVVLALLYIINRSVIQRKVQHDSNVNQLLLIILSTFFIIGIAVFFNSLYSLFLFLPLMVWLAKTDLNKAIVLIVLTTIFFGLYFSNNVFLFLSIIVSIGYTIYKWKSKRTIKLWIVLCILSSVAFLLSEFNLLKIGFIAGVILFFAGTYYKSWLSLIITAATIAVYYFLGRSFINIHTISIALFSLLWILYKQTGSRQWVIYSPVIGFLISLSIIAYTTYNQKQNHSTSNTSRQVEPSDLIENKQEASFLKEGRQLLYAENTLVADHTQSEKIATGFLTLGEYIRLHCFPKELSFYYGYAKIKTVGLTHPGVIISIVIHLLLIVVALWQIKKRPVLTVGIMWYLLSSLLFSNWVELVAGMVGERLAFTASAGFCILIAGVIYWIKPDLSMRKPGIVGAVLGIVIVLFTARTFVRNTDWKDTLTLMSHDIKHLENSAQANNLYAMTLMSNSMTEKQLTPQQKLEIQRTAISHYDKATQLWPDFFNAYIDKGRATLITKDYENGIQALKKAIEIQPENTLPYYILLEITELKGDYNEYLTSAQELFKLQPTDYAYGVVARGYFLLKNYPKSKEVLTEGLKKYPDSGVLINNMAIINKTIK